MDQNTRLSNEADAGNSAEFMGSQVDEESGGHGGRGGAGGVGRVEGGGGGGGGGGGRDVNTNDQDDGEDNENGSEFDPDQSEPEANNILSDPTYAERTHLAFSSSARLTPEAAVGLPLSRYEPPEPARLIYNNMFSHLVLAITELNAQMTETCPDQTAMSMLRALVTLIGFPGEDIWKIFEHGSRNTWILETYAHALRDKREIDYFPIPHNLLQEIHIALAQMDILHQAIETVFPDHEALQLQLFLHQIRTATLAVEHATLNEDISFGVDHSGCSLASITLDLQNLAMEADPQEIRWKGMQILELNSLPDTVKRTLAFLRGLLRSSQ